MKDCRSFLAVGSCLLRTARQPSRRLGSLFYPDHRAAGESGDRAQVRWRYSGLSQSRHYPTGKIPGYRCAGSWKSHPCFIRRIRGRHVARRGAALLECVGEAKSPENHSGPLWASRDAIPAPSAAAWQAARSDAQAWIWSPIVSPYKAPSTIARVTRVLAQRPAMP